MSKYDKTALWYSIGVGELPFQSCVLQSRRGQEWVEPLNSDTIPAGGRQGSKSLLLREIQQSRWDGLILDIF